MMGCLICSQDAGPGFPFLDRTDTRASVTVFLILSTPTNLIVDLPYEDEAPQMALILMLHTIYFGLFIWLTNIFPCACGHDYFASVGFGWQVIDVLSQSQLTVTELGPHLETQKPSQNSFILKVIYKEGCLVI